MTTQQYLPRASLALLVFILLSACATNIAGRKQIMLVSESEAISASSTAYINTLDPYKQKGQLDNNPDQVKRVSCQAF